jgi:cell shape-determining protein MreD
MQLLIGMVLCTQSPTIKYFWKNFQQASQNKDSLFFGLIHIGLMLAAIVVITIGSASAKRKTSDKEKFKTMLVWFSIALVIILVAIPWPFSPLANRPYLPHF